LDWSAGSRQPDLVLLRVLPRLFGVPKVAVSFNKVVAYGHLLACSRCAQKLLLLLLILLLLLFILFFLFSFTEYLDPDGTYCHENNDFREYIYLV
jgi:hypothetical protein